MISNLTGNIRAKLNLFKRKKKTKKFNIKFSIFWSFSNTKWISVESCVTMTRVPVEAAHCARQTNSLKMYLVPRLQKEDPENEVGISLKS